MTTTDALLLIGAFLGILIVGAVVWDWLAGPDPDLLASWDPYPPSAIRDSTCGQADCARLHIHAGWVERGPR